MKRFAPLLALLAGCNSLHVPKEVMVKVAVPCIATKPIAPNITPDLYLKHATDHDLVVLLAADRADLKGYVRELESVVAGCSALP